MDFLGYHRGAGRGGRRGLSHHATPADFPRHDRGFPRHDRGFPCHDRGFPRHDRGFPCHDRGFRGRPGRFEAYQYGPSYNGPSDMHMPPAANLGRPDFYDDPFRHYMEEEPVPGFQPEYYYAHDDSRQANWNGAPFQHDQFPNPPPTMYGPEGGADEVNVPGRCASHPPTNRERYRLFVTMLRCGAKVRDKTYLAMYWLGFSDHGDTRLASPLFENDPGGHAEDRLLEHLRLQLDVVQRERLRSVVIMQNASPCSSCSENYCNTLGDLLGRNSDVQVVIVFSAFHWLRRLSCRHEGHKHRFISKKKHEENREGLRNLCGKGITVRTTLFKDWLQLSRTLQLPLPESLRCEDSYGSSLRGEEDARLRDDLEEILS